MSEPHDQETPSVPELAESDLAVAQERARKLMPELQLQLEDMLTLAEHMMPSEMRSAVESVAQSSQGDGYSAELRNGLVEMRNCCLVEAEINFDTMFATEGWKHFGEYFSGELATRLNGAPSEEKLFGLPDTLSDETPDDVRQDIKTTIASSSRILNAHDWLCEVSLMRDIAGWNDHMSSHGRWREMITCHCWKEYESVPRE